MDRTNFVQALGWIFEHSPWVAEAVWPERPFSSVDQLHASMLNAVRQAGTAKQLELLRAHPDLAKRMQMSEISQSEQQGAGLDRLSPEEYGQFTFYNEQYTARFGFPFIMAVRGQTKETILAAMKDRVAHSREEEFLLALEEVGKIAGFRLSDAVDEGNESSFRKTK
jgi:OHCU decarboxylase